MNCLMQFKVATMNWSRRYSGHTYIRLATSRKAQTSFPSHFCHSLRLWALREETSQPEPLQGNYLSRKLFAARAHVQYRRKILFLHLKGGPLCLLCGKAYTAVLSNFALSHYAGFWLWKFDHSTSEIENRLPILATEWMYIIRGWKYKSYGFVNNLPIVIMHRPPYPIEYKSIYEFQRTPWIA